MLEFFKYIFSSFWTFIGFLFIFSVAGGIITKLFKHFRLWGNINNFYINEPSQKESKKPQSDASEITKVFTDLFNEFKNKGNK
mgnify:CR=1 FL=1|tara:strand:+ start:82 stop:330 length:249 start_codon:yes stop_codon:yes gene_type:complete